MFSRPRKTDSEDDILEMQRKFLAEKAKKSPTFKPAAKVVKVQPEKKPSLYAQKRKIENEKKASEPADTDMNFILGDVVERPKRTKKTLDKKVDKNLPFPKVQKLQITKAASGKSLFATSIENERNEKQEKTAMPSVETAEESKISSEKNKLNLGKTSTLLQDHEIAQAIHEENINILSEMSIGDILEERTKLMSIIDPKLVEFLKKKKEAEAAQAVNINSVDNDSNSPSEFDEFLPSNSNSTTAVVIPNKALSVKGETRPSRQKLSYTDKNDKIKLKGDAGPSSLRSTAMLNSSNSIDIANSSDIEMDSPKSKTTETNPIKSNENAGKSVDNYASAFNRMSKRNDFENLMKTYSTLKSKECDGKKSTDGVSIDIDFSALAENAASANNQINKTDSIDIKNIQPDDNKINPDLNAMGDIPVLNDILGNYQSEKWINFNVIEKEKFEWMKNIENNKNLKPGQTYEARFDWKGVLLPYTEETEHDNRELYLHGDDSFRPGYTLQELFRLARSNLMQQRVAAFTAIGGILNIYNQGFYDSVLELPLIKIFFLLRFGLDDNTPAIVEVVANSMSQLFYNETDETILDLIADTSNGYLQPSLDVDNKEKYTETDSLEMKSNEQNLNKIATSPFIANVPEESESRATITDIELAEVDLIDCLLRTGILQRIFYIFRTLKPQNSTVSSCLKILIRIARTNKDNCLKIISHTNLLNVLFHYFLPSLDSIGRDKTDASIYNYPQHLVLKLFRVLMSHHSGICVELLSKGLLERVKNYLQNKNDIKAHTIKLQIESLRILRSIMIFQPRFSYYKDFLQMFAFLLEWHYQHLNYSDGSPILIKQHASSLLNAIACGPYNQARQALSEKLIMCASKWFYEARKYGIKEFSQSILLSSCLNCVSWGIRSRDTAYMEFIEKYLKTFINDVQFFEYIKNLRCSSVLLKSSKDRRNIFPSLPNLGTILIDENSQPQLIISQLYPVYLLNDLFKLSEALLKQKNNMILISFIRIEIIEIYTEYMRNLSLNVNKKLALNFVAKSEITLICKLICFNGFDSILTKAELLQATFNILACMTSEHVLEISKIFDCVIFNSSNLEFETSILKKWKDIYLATFVYPNRISVSSSDVSHVMPYFAEPILPIDWPYLLLKSILDKYLNPTEYENPDLSEFNESQIIEITFTFTHLLSKDINIVTPTEQLMYYMISFMSKESDFLHPKLKALLKEQIMYFFNTYTDHNFNFDAKFEGKSKFENLYVLFLDHFQAASYGDDLFSALVMIPLAQKYDAKWRKKVWSEHAAVLRFINCDENQLLGSLDAYLQPIEQEISLIKSYAQALKSNVLKENSIPHKIAMHHVAKYRQKKNLSEN